MSNNNIYNYKTPKSGNEETGFFNTKGRINRKSFILRWLFSFGLFVIFTLGYYNSFFAEYESRSFIFFETIYFYILPLFISIFNLIQGAKRMHDVNKSGLYFFIPLYNIYLTFSPGTRGNNDYGIDPSPTKNIQYFDEIESNKQDVKEEVTDSVKKGGLDKWRDHLSNVRKENPNKTYQDILEIARNTYKSEKSTTNKSTDTPKKKSNNYLLYWVLAIAAVGYYYYEVYEPEHRDSDYYDIVDEVPVDEVPVEEEEYLIEGEEYPTVEDTVSADCEGKVGDFFGLTNDLSDLLLTNLKSGKIALGKTTETEMAAIFGDAAAYNKEFDGIRVSAYFTYEGFKLSSIRYDYFYDCESAKSWLSTDKTDIKDQVETVLGATATTSGEGDFTIYDWDLIYYKVSQSNFSDGYALSINK
jgi:uncharacterized membrane protein YhaH (DUF805 family)